MGKNVVVSEVQNVSEKKVKAFIRLSATITLNAHGLPPVIYSPDKIPAELHDMSSKEQSVILQGALIEIDYSLGYPILPHGVSFWNQLPYESQNDFRVFVDYLEKIKEGITPEIDDFASPDCDAYSMFNFNYWHWRGVAWKKMNEASHEHIKRQRVMTSEEKDYLLGEKLIDYGTGMLTKDEVMEKLKGSDIVNIINMGSKIRQDAAVGYDGNNGKDKSKQITPNSISITSNNQYNIGQNQSNLDSAPSHSILQKLTEQEETYQKIRNAAKLGQETDDE